MDQRAIDSTPQEREHPATAPDVTMERSRDRRRKAKVLMVMFVAVIFGAFGDISLRHGMRTIGATEFRSMYQAFLAAIDNIYVIGGVLMLIAFLLLYLASLSWEDLSYVLPLTATDYVLVTIMAFFLLREDVTPMRWVGSVLVATGIAFVART